MQNALDLLMLFPEHAGTSKERRTDIFCLAAQFIAEVTGDRHYA